MARITVDDCLDAVPSRFELILFAAHRARAIAKEVPITVERDGDKDTVVALRELAGKTIFADDLREGLIQSIQKNGDDPGVRCTPSPARGVKATANHAQLDTIPMTEEQLRQAMETMPPREPTVTPG